MKAQAFTPVKGLAHGYMSMGADGMHPLFHSHWIRRAFSRLQRGAVNEPVLLAAHGALRRLAELGTLESMRQHLEQLPDETVDLVIFLYFRSLDQFLESREPTVH